MWGTLAARVRAPGGKSTAAGMAGLEVSRTVDVMRALVCNHSCGEGDRSNRMLVSPVSPTVVDPRSSSPEGRYASAKYVPEPTETRSGPALVVTTICLTMSPSSRRTVVGTSHCEVVPSNALIEIKRSLMVTPRQYREGKRSHRHTR